MEQVQYACIDDAFVSYEVGRLLLTGQHAGDAATSATIQRCVFRASPVLSLPIA
jgi:hypothetical protein